MKDNRDNLGKLKVIFGKFGNNLKDFSPKAT